MNRKEHKEVFIGISGASMFTQNGKQFYPIKGNYEMKARKTRKTTLSLIIVLMLVFSLVSSALASGEDVAEDATLYSAQLNDNNQTCPNTGIDDWIKVDNTPEGVFSYPLYYAGVQHGTATTNDPSKGLVSVALDAGWTVDLCVKGGVKVVFAYGLTDGQNSGEEVLGGSGSPADISHFSYRLHPPVTPGQWCSPGFWKNNNGAWGPTGYLPTSIDSITGKTFGFILSNPKTYARTGDFERIADILSDAHPDVNFQGERVADSCPLSADEANR